MSTILVLSWKYSSLFQLLELVESGGISGSSGSIIKMLQTPALPRINAIEARNIRIYPFMTRYRL